MLKQYKRRRQFPNFTGEHSICASKQLDSHSANKVIQEERFMMDQYNYTSLSGKVHETPIFDHQTCGEKFYRLTLAVERLSGNVDYLPVLFSERLIDAELRLDEDEDLVVEGQIRTYDKVLNDGKNHHLMVAFAKFLYNSEILDVQKKNYVCLSGTICQAPVYRRTPFGREICDVCLVVNRAYGKCDYINTICWGRNARFVSQLQVGERLKVEGRFQSRPYIKKVVTEKETYEEERIAYEVSCARIYHIYDEQ